MATKGKTGTFLGVPYNWERPTWEREKKAWWDVDTDQFVVPRAYGWGYAFNLAKLAGKTRK